MFKKIIRVGVIACAMIFLAGCQRTVIDDQDPLFANALQERELSPERFGESILRMQLALATLKTEDKSYSALEHKIQVYLQVVAATTGG